MAYDPASLRAGDIILCESGPRERWYDALLDDAIRFSTASPFCHACIVGPHKTIIEALWHVRESPLDKYAESGWAYRVNAPSGASQKAARFAWSSVGRVYSIEAILADGARYDLHFIPRGWARSRRWTCSGFVTVAWQHAGVTLTHAPWPSPADLSYSPLLIGKRPWDSQPPSGGFSVGGGHR